jgi:F0F1-type ATP synthase assembly protein I
MGQKTTPPRFGLTDVYRFSGLGCAFAAGVLAFLAGGWALDRWLGTLPVFSTIGALIGAALATLSIWRRLQGPDGP